MHKQESLFYYLLRLGDNALILGHRLSEWCSRGPILEEDLALTNMSLDQIGRANALLTYAGEVEGKGRTADDLAYKRGEREFYNNLMHELPNGDFAFTMARQLILSTFELNLYQRLCESSDLTLSALAAKAVKESRYHSAHARDWNLRLGKGTEESHRRLQQAYNELWMYTGELFEMYDADALLANEKIACDLNLVKATTTEQLLAAMRQADITMPMVDYMQTGSRAGIHTEHLGHLLSEMQYLQRAYPDAKW
jgi:ring-1,2-phenylacetyl-CoA epoxidase subunit PaaC